MEFLQRFIVTDWLSIYVRECSFILDVNRSPLLTNMLPRLYSFKRKILHKFLEMSK